MKFCTLILTLTLLAMVLCALAADDAPKEDQLTAVADGEIHSIAGRSVDKDDAQADRAFEGGQRSMHGRRRAKSRKSASRKHGRKSASGRKSHHMKGFNEEYHKDEQNHNNIFYSSKERKGKFIVFGEEMQKQATSTEGRKSAGKRTRKSSQGKRRSGHRTMD